jgi:hypothetical protein
MPSPRSKPPAGALRKRESRRASRLGRSVPPRLGGAVGAAVATTDCVPTAIAEYGGVPIPAEIEDSSASDGTSAVVADARDASATSEPTDSSTPSDAKRHRRTPVAEAAFGGV